MANQIVQLLFKVATDEKVCFDILCAQKMEANLVPKRSYTGRSLAVLTLRACIDTLGMMRGAHGADVDVFATGAINLWMPFLISVIEAPLPPADNQNNKGMITLKIQSTRVCSMDTETQFRADDLDNSSNPPLLYEFI